jgi:FtsH-binding integral membrane protein
MLRLYLIEFLIFGRCLLQYARYIRGVLFGLTVLVVSGGIALAYVEEMPLGDAIYFAFVTGLTIGYGDIAPVTLWGRVISICIGFVGVLFTGLYIALATRALADTKQYLNHPKKGDDSPPTKQS